MEECLALLEKEKADLQITIIASCAKAERNA
jgi:hypothetical protein